MPSPDVVKQEDEQSHIENQSTTHIPPPPPPPPPEEEEEEDDEGEGEGEGEEEEEEEDDDDEEEDDDEDEEEDLNFDSPSSTSIPDPPPKVSILEQTPQPLLIDQKLQIITPITTTPTPTTPIEEKKPPMMVSVASSDESRKLFQRLWTDEDEIGLLQGYLDFTIQRGGYHNSSYHHDTGPFYDQIKTRLQLDFNKNQLVEKLRRLKKKYRNVVTRATSGKEVSFKTPHDQSTYEIARKIWGDGSSSRSVGGGAKGGGGGSKGGGGGLQEQVGMPAAADDDQGNPLNSSNVNNDVKPNIVNVEKKVPATPTARRSQKRAAEAELPNMPKFRAESSTTNAIEDTVRSCLSPLFKELINCATNGPCNLGGLSGVALNPMPMNFGGNPLMNFGNGEKLDERWRNQQILELEVYSKRIELVQDQIKSTLEDLRSMDK